MKLLLNLAISVLIMLLVNSEAEAGKSPRPAQQLKGPKPVEGGCDSYRGEAKCYNSVRLSSFTLSRHVLHVGETVAGTMHSGWREWHTPTGGPGLELIGCSGDALSSMTCNWKATSSTGGWAATPQRAAGVGLLVTVPGSRPVTDGDYWAVLEDKWVIEGTVTGKEEDPDNPGDTIEKGIEGVRINVVEQGGKSKAKTSKKKQRKSKNPGSYFVDTDADGYYYFLLKKGRYAVSASGGYCIRDDTSCKASKQVALPGSQVVDFTAAASYTLEGHVKDENGKPLAEVALEIAQNGDTYSATTDSEGYYSVLLPEGSYLVRPIQDDECAEAVPGLLPAAAEVMSGKRRKKKKPQKDDCELASVELKGRTAMSFKVPARPDLQIESIEISQGIQREGVPFAREEFSLAGFVDPVPGYLYENRGVPLVERRFTLVRMYTSVVPGASIPTSDLENVDAQLRGYRVSDGGLEPLPGHPLQPLNSPGELPATALLPNAQASAGEVPGLFLFQLPPSWMRGEITLVGELNPGSFTDSKERPISECEDCLKNNAFAIANIKLKQMPAITVNTEKVFFLANSGSRIEVLGPPDAPHPSFELARTLVPLGQSQLRVLPYQNLRDITPIVLKALERHGLQEAGAPFPTYGALEQCITGSPCWYLIAQQVVKEQEFDLFENRWPAPLVGLWFLGGGMTSGIGRVSVASSTPHIVMHELLHQYNFDHASAACGAEDAVDWPPDQMGYIHGIGVDLRSSDGFGTKILAPQERWYDVMGYCGKEDSTWLSTNNWTKAVDEGMVHRSALQASQRIRTTEADSLSVNVLMDENGGAEILSLRRGVVPATPPAEGALYKLVGRNSAGAVMVELSLTRQESLHSPVDNPFSLLTAVIPAKEVALVEVVRIESGSVLATRSQSQSAPTVSILNPSKATKIGAEGDVQIRWESADGDGDVLTANIDFSADGGNSWRRIFSGPDRSSAVLPAALFTKARSGKIRITVSDGFTDATAISEPFAVKGRGPTVVIVNSGLETQTLNAGSPFELVGYGLDELGAELSGSQLKWVDGKKRIGSGESVDLAKLKPGKHRIRLIGRDRQKRSASAAITVRVLGRGIKKRKKKKKKRKK